MSDSQSIEELKNKYYRPYKTEGFSALSGYLLPNISGLGLRSSIKIMPSEIDKIYGCVSGMSSIINILSMSEMLRGLRDSVTESDCFDEPLHPLDSEGLFYALKILGDDLRGISEDLCEKAKTLARQEIDLLEASNG